MADINYSPVDADSAILKPEQFQDYFTRNVMVIGQTLGAFFTPAIYPPATGNVGFDFGVKTGDKIAQIGGEKIADVIAGVNESIANIASGAKHGITTFAINSGMVIVIVIMLMFLMKKAVS